MKGKAVTPATPTKLTVDELAEAASESPSMRAAVQGLDVGESFSRCVRFDGEKLNKVRVEAAERGLRLATQPTVHRVAKASRRTFAIETGEFLTRSRDLMFVLCVTRLT
jgi:hypothetical protein